MIAAELGADGIPAPTAAAPTSNSAVRVLPNRYGGMMLVILAVMLLGSINYSNNLGYALTFLLIGVWCVTLLHAYRNIRGIEMVGSRAPPVFAGETANFDIFLRQRDVAASHGLMIEGGDGRICGPFSVSADSTHCAHLSVPAPRRGLLRLTGITINSSFPLAICSARRPWPHELTAYVYPQPAGALPLPIDEDTRVYAPGVNQLGHDDFAGLRSYRTGDSLRHIAWKVLARERGLLVKHFAGGGMEIVHLRQRDLARIADIESQLSQLTRWVLDAEAAGIPYSLTLNDGEIEAGLGEAHRDRCLRLLALSPPQ